MATIGFTINESYASGGVGADANDSLAGLLNIDFTNLSVTSVNLSGRFPYSSNVAFTNSPQFSVTHNSNGTYTVVGTNNTIGSNVNNTRLTLVYTPSSTPGAPPTLTSVKAAENANFGDTPVITFQPSTTTEVIQINEQVRPSESLGGSPLTGFIVYNTATGQVTSASVTSQIGTPKSFNNPANYTVTQNSDGSFTAFAPSDQTTGGGPDAAYSLTFMGNPPGAASGKFYANYAAAGGGGPTNRTEIRY